MLPSLPTYVKATMAALLLKSNRLQYNLMEWFKKTWRNVPQPARKITVFVVGWTVVAAGVAMLALPGPGWAAIFLGFAILATEYTSARHIRDWMVGKLKAVIAWLKKTFNR